MIFEYLLEAMSLTRIAKIRKSNTEANVEINRLIFLTRIIRPSLSGTKDQSGNWENLVHIIIMVVTLLIKIAYK